MKRNVVALRPGGFPGLRRLAPLAVVLAIGFSSAAAQDLPPGVITEPVIPEPRLPADVIPVPVNPFTNPNGLRKEALKNHLASLKSVPVPIPSNISDFVTNERAVIALGKALFWEEQAGSDGMSCASCHFHAGADSRVKNQVSPSILGGNGTFDFFASNPASGGPNYTFKRDDFPFHQKVDETSNDLGANVRFDTDDVASSGGVLDVAFLGLGARTLPRTLTASVNMDVFLIRKLVNAGILPSSALHASVSLLNQPFNPSINRRNPEFSFERLRIEEVDPVGFFMESGGKMLNTRRVEPRNTPTVINAVFNHRNFWDGRANFHFNGRNPFGPRDPNAKVFEFDGYSLNEVAISLDNASLASQAVGPAESVMEMSAHYRNFLHIAKKLFNSRPLRKQEIAYDDSVLGPFTTSSPTKLTTGLKFSYPDLISMAFDKKWWSAAGEPITVDGETYTHMEANFSMFWGIAIMMYERTLVSDQTPFDAFMEGDNNALTPTQRKGLSLFIHEGKCANCHHGGEFTGASIDALRLSFDRSQLKLIERMMMGDHEPAIYDNGFYNINVRPTAEDPGVGGTDAFGNPLSFSVQGVNGTVVDKIDRFEMAESPVQPGEKPRPDERVAVMGAFKTPGLRNVDLTGPYFHNGGKLTLEQVVQFYSRGTDFFDAQPHDSDPDVDGVRNPTLDGLASINGDRTKIRALAAFLRTLTDPRVAYERAPFDHPSLNLPNGHVGDTYSVTEDSRLRGSALTEFVKLPAVGAKGLDTPIQPFLGGSLVNGNGVATDDGLARIHPVAVPAPDVHPGEVIVPEAPEIVDPAEVVIP